MFNAINAIMGGMNLNKKKQEQSTTTKQITSSAEEESPLIKHLRNTLQSYYSQVY